MVVDSSCNTQLEWMNEWKEIEGKKEREKERNQHLSHIMTALIPIGVNAKCLTETNSVEEQVFYNDF